MGEESIKEFIESLRDTDIVELSFERENLKLNFHRDQHMLKPNGIPDKTSLPLNNGTEKQPETPINFVKIKSTMVGTFHASASSDRPPLIVEGDHVMPGQKVGMIEAMKVLKDVISTVQGKVEKVLVQDGNPVEYGQPLFRINIQA